jgi:ferredoxin
VKVFVDDERCRGHAVCCALCPQVFSLTSDGYTVVEIPQVPAEFEKAVLAASGSCPERAITVQA